MPPAPVTAPKKDRTVLIVLVAVFGMLLMSVAPVLIVFSLYALIGGGVLGFAVFIKPGTVHVVCPVESTVQVKLDGSSPMSLDPGEHVKLDLDRGEHVIVVSDGASGRSVTHKVEVKTGFFDQVAPASDDQCFVTLDMTDFSYPLYRAKGTEPPMPVLFDTHDERLPFDLPSSTYLDMDEMPENIESGSSVYLMLDIPCGRLSGTDAEILTNLGF